MVYIYRVTVELTNKNIGYRLRFSHGKQQGFCIRGMYMYVLKAPR